MAEAPHVGAVAWIISQRAIFIGASDPGHLVKPEPTEPEPKLQNCLGHGLPQIHGVKSLFPAYLICSWLENTDCTSRPCTNDVGRASASAQINCRLLAIPSLYLNLFTGWFTNLQRSNLCCAVVSSQKANFTQHVNTLDRDNKTHVPHVPMLKQFNTHTHTSK